MALTDCISVHGASAQGLLAFEQQRLVSGQQVVERARRLGDFMQANVASGVAKSRLVRDANQVMMETAVDLSSEPAAFVSSSRIAAALI